MIAVFYPSGPKCPLVDTEHDESKWKTGELAPTIFKVRLRICSLIGIKAKGAESIPLLRTAGMDEGLVEDDVPVLNTTRAQPEGKKSESTQTFFAVSPVKIELTP